MTLATLEAFVAELKASGIAPDQEIVLRHKGGFERLQSGRAVPMYDVLFDDGETDTCTEDDLRTMRLLHDYVSHKPIDPIVFLSTGR
jgi:hypothetical protein